MKMRSPPKNVFLIHQFEWMVEAKWKWKLLLATQFSSRFRHVCQGERHMLRDRLFLWDVGLPKGFERFFDGGTWGNLEGKDWSFFNFSERFVAVSFFSKKGFIFFQLSLNSTFRV